jgi:hypothetical protein
MLIECFTRKRQFQPISNKNSPPSHIQWCLLYCIEPVP